jgi:hypothetical protein
MLAPARSIAVGDDPEVLDRVWRAPCHAAVWRRMPDPAIAAAARALTQDAALDLHAAGDGAGVATGFAVALARRVPHADLAPLLGDIAGLVDRFRRLLRLDVALAQIETVARDGCRYFHADRVHGRLLCTYAGPGTVIAPEEIVDRRALGSGSNERILRGDPARLIRLDAGDVGLLMGDLAPGESGRGVVHRSPAIAGTGIVRLVLRVDLPGACGCAAHQPFRFRL